MLPTSGWRAPSTTPEQRRGEAVDARADQFALCVVLDEALGAGAPAWLKRIVARGRAERPEDRFPDMTALAAALDADPARRRRPWLLGVALVAVIVAGAGAARFAGARAAALCSGGEEQLSGVWDEPRKAALARVFHRGGQPWTDDSWRAFAAALDGYPPRRG